MGGWADDIAVQRKAQFRLLASLPAFAATRMSGQAGPPWEDEGLLNSG
jgi:hypothetical protein